MKTFVVISAIMMFHVVFINAFRTNTLNNYSKKVFLGKHQKHQLPRTLKRQGTQFIIGKSPNLTGPPFRSLPVGSEDAESDKKEVLQQHVEKVFSLHENLVPDPDNPLDDRFSHNLHQAAAFDNARDFFASEEAVPEEVIPRLQRIADATNVPKDGVILDIGTGTAALIPYLKAELGPSGSVIGIDLSSGMLDIAKQRQPDCQFFQADFIDFKDANDSSVDAVVFNAMFGNIWDQKAALKRASELLKEGGRIVISHPLGAEFVEGLRMKDPTIVPNPLPSNEAILEMIKFLPLKILSYLDEKESYIAVLERTTGRALETIIGAKGKVSKGYGRGGKKLAVPTANLPESQFADKLREIQTGVYFGWAAVEGIDGVHKAVVNIGYSPTFVGKENPEKIIEAHLMKDLQQDFYEKEMRVLLLGFKRQEQKFASFQQLVETINKDIKDASELLDQPEFKRYSSDDYLTQNPELSISWNLMPWS